MRHFLSALIILSTATAQAQQAQDTSWNYVRNGGFELVSKPP